MELLDYLGVADRADHYPNMLSGGQQQRVAVARALANRPDLLLADEPTAALDSVRGRQVMELFRKVAHEQHAGVIVVTHDHRSLDVFDRALEMEDGFDTRGAVLVNGKTLKIEGGQVQVGDAKPFVCQTCGKTASERKVGACCSRCPKRA